VRAEYPHNASEVEVLNRVRLNAISDLEPPAAARPGDATGVMALFNAARLSLRSGAAPFRSLGRISVTPRPYQFVPLIMALRLDPVRLVDLLVEPVDPARAAAAILGAAYCCS
jgi:hypothetical protein